LAALTLIPLLVSLAFGDLRISLRYGIVAGGLGLAGFWPARLPRPERVQVNEGMVVVALIFLIAPLVMAYPMMASGLGFEDALFETVSGATTTGLSTQADVESAPRTFLFARAWMQWYGGLGVMVLSLGMVLQPGLVAKGLAAVEGTTGDLAGRRCVGAWLRDTAALPTRNRGVPLRFWLARNADFP
jgi:trk system potassium uptake protein TrkH